MSEGLELFVTDDGEYSPTICTHFLTDVWIKLKEIEVRTCEQGCFWTDREVYYIS